MILFMNAFVFMTLRILIQCDALKSVFVSLIVWVRNCLTFVHLKIAFDDFFIVGISFDR